MCGICGIVLSPRSSRSISRDVIEAMRDIIVHRGPDGAGIFTDQRAGLEHRRLSIVDVSHGQQPMASDDGVLQIVYNGEVYNHPTLSAELRASGVRYNTHCDTETVLRAYEVFGERCVDRSEGCSRSPFGTVNGKNLLARDRLGVKPLYYALLGDGSIVFGSEIKSLLASGLIRPELSFAALPRTTWRITRRREKKRCSSESSGCCQGTSLAGRGRRVERYWELTAGVDSNAKADERELVGEIESG